MAKTADKNNAKDVNDAKIFGAQAFQLLNPRVACSIHTWPFLVKLRRRLRFFQADSRTARCRPSTRLHNAYVYVPDRLQLLRNSFEAKTS